MSTTLEHVHLWRATGFQDLELYQARHVHHNFPKHAHPGYTLGVIEHGTGANRCRGALQVSPAGALVAMNPDEVHTGYAVEGPCTYRMMYISEQDLAAHLPPGVSLPHFRQNVIADPKWARRLWLLLEVLASAHEPLAKEQHLARTLGGLFLAHGLVREAAPTRSDHAAVQRMRSFLDEALAQKVSLSDLSDLTGLHRATIVRLFTQHAGLPPYTYLLQRRVEAAKQLLRAKKPVAEVALEVGFADQAHLTKTFKRLTGITPGRYGDDPTRHR